MPKVNFNPSDWQRKVADAASLILKNRYFETTQSLTDDGASLNARAGLRKLTSVGAGPIRGMMTAPGSFLGDLFVASGAEFYRMTKGLVQTLVYSGLNDPLRGVVNMAITGRIGATPEFNFIADGANLFVYMEDGYARNALSGSVVSGDSLNLGGVYYQWTNASVDAGTPAGTLANPWLVNFPGTTALALRAMYKAINADGIPGTDYSTALTAANASVRSDSYSVNFLSVMARVNGVEGNAIVSTETGAGIAWVNPGMLYQGGEPTFSKVQMPEDIGAIDVTVINSYVIVIPVQEGEYNGRFYFIEPGETVVNELNFATAERSPDQVYGARVFGDQFWLPGESTTEVWYTTGDVDAPVARLQGVVIDRGSYQNTPVALHETLMLVDADGGVFKVQGSSPARVSDPGIEEQIRLAIQAQNAYLY